MPTPISLLPSLLVFDMNLPTVVVLRNGFAPLSKPKGEQFDVCAEGRLLMLSAWSHSNEHITLTAWDCQQKKSRSSF